MGVGREDFLVRRQRIFRFLSAPPHIISARRKRAEGTCVWSGWKTSISLSLHFGVVELIGQTLFDGRASKSHYFIWSAALKYFSPEWHFFPETIEWVWVWTERVKRRALTKIKWCCFSHFVSCCFLCVPYNWNHIYSSVDEKSKQIPGRSINKLKTLSTSTSKELFYI